MQEYKHILLVIGLKWYLEYEVKTALFTSLGGHLAAGITGGDAFGILSEQFVS